MTTTTNIPPRSKRACDRCHSLKERCCWLPNSTICTRCMRLRYNDCQINRPLKKVGRKRRPQISRKPILSMNSQNGHSESVTSEDSGSSEQDSDTAMWSSSPGTTISSIPDASSIAETTVHIPSINDLPNHLFPSDQIEPLEEYLWPICLGMTSPVGRFTIARQFHRSHQEVLLSRLISAFPLLKDGVLSCAVVFASLQNIQMPGEVQALCRKKAASSLSTFRSLQLTTKQDVQTCLALGTAITTFALYVAGGEVYYVCQHALNLMKPLLSCNEVVIDDGDRSYLVCLTFTELCECLLRCERPTLPRNAISSEIGHVDRYIGLSIPLLPILHDICELNYSKFHNRHENSLPESIETAATNWQPEPPDDFVDCYSRSEVVNILLQAKVLRFTAMLIMHRIQYPYGTNNDKGLVLAQSILSDLELAHQLTGNPIKCADLGLLAASFELDQPEARAQAMSLIDNLLHYSQQVRGRIRDTLTNLWYAKEHSDSIYWYNLRNYWTLKRTG